MEIAQLIQQGAALQNTSDISAAVLEASLLDAAPEYPLFDETELLDNFDYDVDFAKSILADAITEIPKDVIQLHEFCLGGTVQAVHHQAHTIKGMAANLCTPALREIALKIEMAAKEGDLKSSCGLLPELEQTAQSTISAINRWIQSC